MNANTIECLLCRKQRGEYFVPGGVIYSDNWVYVSHAHLPEGESTQYLGWVTVESRRHIPGFADLSNDEAQAVGLLAAQLSRTILDVTPAEHVYAFVLGHHIPHFHLHLIPRYPGTPREYWGVRIDEWAEAPRGDAAQIDTFSARVRAILATMRQT